MTLDPGLRKKSKAFPSAMVKAQLLIQLVLSYKRVKICSYQPTLSGVDVMITIFCDFCQFSAKKLAFFSKTNVMIKILHNLPLF
jgi:hypothetical protein